MSTRIAVVDDHELVRRGIADLLTEEPDLDVVAEAGTVREALAFVPPARPDVAVLDVRLPDGNGIELCRELRSVMPEMRCLILTSFSDDEAFMNSLMAGASGYVLKQVLGSDLCSAIRTAAAGGTLNESGTTEAMLTRLRGRQEQRDPLRELGAQERTVLELIGQGMTNRQIAERMFLAEKTVKNYVSQLLSKLGMRRRTQAAVLATELRRSGGSERRGPGAGQE
ncbi:response regulator [Parasphingorhabdus pacifica]